MMKTKWLWAGAGVMAAGAIGWVIHPYIGETQFKAFTGDQLAARTLVWDARKRDDTHEAMFWMNFIDDLPHEQLRGVWDPQARYVIKLLWLAQGLVDPPLDE